MSKEDTPLRGKGYSSFKSLCTKRRGGEGIGLKSFVKVAKE